MVSDAQKGDYREMKTLRVAFVDFSDISQEFFIAAIEKYKDVHQYEVELCEPQDADLAFYSTFGTGHLFLPERTIKIFYTGENLRPDFNICDYALGFDYMDYGDRYMRLPLYNLYMYDRPWRLTSKRRSLPEIKDRKFCSFVVSNASANETRVKLFHLLSQYKQVDSGGRLLNNVGGPVEDKLQFDMRHKFSICCENTSFPGYTTEKIAEAFAAGCIPIYYGDPLIGRVFNTKAFINVLGYDSLETVVERVIQIDQDEDLYHSMLHEPILVSEDYEYDRAFEDLARYLGRILEKGIENAQRCSREYYTNYYRNQLREWCVRSTKKNIIRKIVKRIIH